MPRPLVILLLTAALAGGCARHTKTKTDNSAATGFAGVDAGTKRIEAGVVTVQDGPLTAAQQVGVKEITQGVFDVREGTATARKAYDAAAKLNEPDQRKQNDRINLLMLVGAVTVAVGIFLLVGGSTFGVAYGVATIASGLGFIVTLMLMKAITPAMEYAAIGLVVIGLGAAAYLVYERLYRKKQLAVEQKATKELVATVQTMRQELGPVGETKMFGKSDDPQDSGAIGKIQSDSTQELVKDAKQKLAGDILEPAGGTFTGVAIGQTTVADPVPVPSPVRKHPARQSKEKRR